MGVFTYGQEITTSVPAATLFKAFVTDSDELIPKAAPPILNIEKIEGTGGPGTVKRLNMFIGGVSKYVLHKIESIDEANFIYKYSIVGSTDFPDTLEEISFEKKFFEGPNGGCIKKITMKYFTKGDDAPSEEELKADRFKCDALFKDVEAYLLAHPEYN